jgi:hypothetical protein
MMGWEFKRDSADWIRSAYSWPDKPSGLYIYFASKDFKQPRAGEGGYWQYNAQGDTALFKADFLNMGHLDAESCVKFGFWDGDQWTQSTGYNCSSVIASKTHCARGTCGTDVASGMSARFKMQADNDGPRGRTGWSRLGGARVYLHDPAVPKLTAPVSHLQTDKETIAYAGQWRNEPLWGAGLLASDTGLGVKAIEIKRADEIQRKDYDCTSRCQTNLDPTAPLPVQYTQAAGRHVYEATAIDPVGQRSTPPVSWTVAYDPTAPRDLALSRPLPDTNGGYVTEPLALTPSATDGPTPAAPATQSGVKSAQLLVDGEAAADAMAGNQRIDLPAADDRSLNGPDQQPAELLTFDPDAVGADGEFLLADGEHAVGLEVRDVAGNVQRAGNDGSPREITVKVDHTRPDATLQGPLFAAGGVGDGQFKVDLALHDAGSGVQGWDVTLDGAPLADPIASADLPCREAGAC